MGFKIKAADGANLEIQDGEWYFNTKPRCRRMMQNSLSSDARRVYACLELATMGFQQELAVTMERGEQRPLTPADIRQQTGLLKQHVTRGLVELEDAGLATRKAPDGGALRKGNVLIYSWAVPREPKNENSNRARLLFPDWFPESWEPLKPLISRFKYSLIDDEVTARGYFEEIATAARGYQEAEMVARRALERICAGTQRARASSYRKNGKNIERTAAAKPSVQLAESAAAGAASLPHPHGPDRDLPDAPVPSSPPPTPPEPLSLEGGSPGEPPPPDPVLLIADAAKIDSLAARKILRDCQRRRPGITPQEIAVVAQMKRAEMDKQGGIIRTPTGLLMSAVPELCADDRALERARERIRSQPRNGAPDPDYWREIWPGLSAEDRATMLTEYPEIAGLVPKASGDD